MFERSEAGFPWPFLTILVFWLVTLFVTFGLLAPRNATNLYAQMIRLSHAVRPLVMSNGEDHSADSERFLNEPLSAAPAAQLRRLKASSPPRAQILSQRTRVIRHVIEFPGHLGIVEIARGVTDQQRNFCSRTGTEQSHLHPPRACS
jgi:hypothetical protein